VLDRNFDLRASIYRIKESNLQVVQAARKAGASAKFAGSGGAFIGTCPDDATFDRVKTALEKLGAVVIRPQIL
jgi:glucuronokinase